MSQHGLPTSLNDLIAAGYLGAKGRARGELPVPNFERLFCSEGKANKASVFSTMKAAVLAIEAALPAGSVDNSETGVWRRSVAEKWRFFVRRARGSVALMRCVMILEEVIAEDWLRTDVGHLRACLPFQWKAIADASPASLAIRILLLDRAVLYGTVDKVKYATPKKSRKVNKK
jgi:hypothetical protein